MYKILISIFLLPAYIILAIIIANILIDDYKYKDKWERMDREEGGK